MRRLEAPVIGVVIVGAEHGVRAGYYGYYGYYGYGYGYAHPGEVSVMQRLMPWKAGRKGRVPDPVRAPRPVAARPLPWPVRPGDPDGDDGAAARCGAAQRRRPLGVSRGADRAGTGMATADIVVARSPRVLWRSGPFGVVVLGPDSATPLVLEGTGAVLWEELGAPRSMTELAAGLAARYDVAADVVARDIEPVIDALLASGACEVAE